jgi:chorismate dehydratase
LSKKIRVGAVSYLNTKPLLYGLQQHAISENIELIEDYPANLAKALIDNTIDIGLVPVAIIPSLPEAHIISDYCIGAIGPVASVCIFSKVPMDEIKTVYLDYQSRTSIKLAQILLKNYWKREVLLLEAPDNFIDLIDGTTAAVIIGDRALEQYKSYPYVYDLAEAWVSYTEKPFVFATWIANKPISTQFMKQFNLANSYGINHLEEVIAKITMNYTGYDLYKYYTRNISYLFTSEKKKGMELFLKSLIDY